MRAEEILSVLDACARAFTFPMLDNGYVYLAATRLALFRSDADWAITIEVFGFSPRTGFPDVNVSTFASTLRNRKDASHYVSAGAYEQDLANNPNSETEFYSPIDDEGWFDPENPELVATDAEALVLRGERVRLPSRPEYGAHGIELEQPSRVQTFELCRYLAAVAREKVLATESERTAHVPASLRQLLRLEEWHHPDLVSDELPSTSPTFRQLARVLETGDVEEYRPTLAPNTHWRHWPDGGTL